MLFKMPLLLLIKFVLFTLVSSNIGALLLWYTTKMARFKAFFVTCFETAAWSFFIVTGFGALLSSIVCRFLCVALYFCNSIAGCSSLSCATFLFLDSSFYLVCIFALGMTIVQSFVLRDHYRLDDGIILAILGLSSLCASCTWYVCLKLLCAS